MAKVRLSVNGKYYPVEDRMEREQLEEVKYRTRYASAGVKALAIARHMAKWRLYYNIPTVYKAEKLALDTAFAPNDFELLPSCD